jgi:hypothetical protein
MEQPMIYAYICRPCRIRANLDYPLGKHPSTLACGGCGESMSRDYSGVSVHRPMPEHFNATVGKPISSMRQFDDELKRKSDEYTLRTGIEAKFVSHDPSEARALGVTSEGISEQKAAALGL